MPHGTYPSSPVCHMVHTHPPHYATRYIPILPTMPHGTYLSSPLCHTIHTHPPHYATRYIPRTGMYRVATMPHDTYPSSPCHTIHTRPPHYATRYIPLLSTMPHNFNLHDCIHNTVGSNTQPSCRPSKPLPTQVSSQQYNCVVITLTDFTYLFTFSL